MTADIPATVVMGIACFRCHTKIGVIIASANPKPLLQALNAHVLCPNCYKGFLEEAKKDDNTIVINLRTDQKDPFADVAN